MTLTDPLTPDEAEPPETSTSPPRDSPEAAFKESLPPAEPLPLLTVTSPPVSPRQQEWHHVSESARACLTLVKSIDHVDSGSTYQWHQRSLLGDRVHHLCGHRRCPQPGPKLCLLGPKMSQL